jgi:hypothetical protein
MGATTTTATGNWIDALQLLINASASFPAIQVLILVLTTIIGVLLVASSLFNMYHLSAMSGVAMPGSGGPTPLGVLGKFLIGGVLVSSAYWMYIGGNTFIGTNVNTSSMLYGGTATTYCDQAQYAVFFFIALVGQVAFVRGWLYLNRYFNGPRNEGLGMGVTFIVGGVGCYFMPDLGALLADWFGLSMSISVLC